MDFTPQQISTLQRLHSRGFEIVTFPMYANYVGIRKRGPQVDGESSLGDLSCAALLTPVVGGGFSIYTKPTFLIAGNFTVRITRNGRDFFVWKEEELKATPALLGELETFAAALSQALLPTA
jgi:hypothetical protein